LVAASPHEDSRPASEDERAGSGDREE